MSIYMSRKLNKKFWLTVNCKHCSKQFMCRISKPRIFCGIKCSSRDVDLNKQRLKNQKQTNVDRHGGHHMKSGGVEKCKATLLVKYGVDSYSKLPEYRIRVKKTLFEKFGDENYLNVEKVKKTCLERYGVDNISKLKHVSEKSSETKKSNHYNFLLDHCKEKSLEFLCDKENYKGYHFSNIYKMKCNVCLKTFESTVYNLHNIFCDYCYPEKITSVENQFYTFLQEILDKNIVIKRNDRTRLNGKELDFYIPELKIAFEINGLYWHSEFAGGRNKNYHLNKTKSCMHYGITLVHIFENEWIHKSDIVKSVIKSLLNLTKTKIYGRECIIKEIDIKTKNDFLTKNHLQGEDKSTVKLGVYKDENLLSVMTFRKTSRFEKTSEWELVRFCTLIDTVVIGGASKLLSYFIKTYHPKNIVTYSDRRFFTGKIYETLGFKFVDITPCGYYYIINKYKDLRHRMSFQKHKIKNFLNVFDPNLSEWENMKNNGYDRIWDCGNNKYYLKLSE